MTVTIIFPSDKRLTGESISWGCPEGAIPRVGDQIDISDPAAPRSRVLVRSVIWNVTKRGFSHEVTVIVS